MKSKQINPYSALERVFHEPNRLAILSALCTESDGLTFNTLKEECQLTDGNLSRHLRALEDQKIIRIKKSFVRNKPQTTILLTDHGRDRFIEYLQALEAVLKKAAASVATQESERHLPVGLLKLLRT
jgi:DNA-binding transcriptional ArsR family regulator